MGNLVTTLLSQQRLEVLVVDFLLLVCQVKEGVVEVLECLALDVIT